MLIYYLGGPGRTCLQDIQKGVGELPCGTVHMGGFLDLDDIGAKYVICGEKKVPGSSARVPPVFHSPDLRNAFVG